MSDARSVLSEMQISQAEHLPLVTAFLARMGLAEVVGAAAPTDMAVDLGSVVKLMILGHALREEPSLSPGALRWFGRYGAAPREAGQSRRLQRQHPGPRPRRLSTSATPGGSSRRSRWARQRPFPWLNRNGIGGRIGPECALLRRV